MIFSWPIDCLEKMLVNLQKLRNIWNFFLLFISNFITLILEKILCMISTLINLRLILWADIWIMYIYMIYSGFSRCIYVVYRVSQVFCFLDELMFSFIFHIWLLKSPTFIVELSICPFNSDSFCLVYFESLLLGAYMF